MKNIIKIITTIFIFSNSSVFSQVYQTGNGGLNFFRLSSNYRSAKIEMIDGTVKNGFITGFIENNNIEFGDFRQFSNFEHQLNLDDNKFKFKETLESESQKITQENIKSISLVNDSDIKTYYLIDVYAVDKKTKKLESLNRKVWLPLLYEGKETNIYGFNLFTNNRYIFTYYYISNGENNAIRFFDDSMGLCGQKCYLEYYTAFLYEVFVKKCEAMKPNVDQLLKETNIEKAKELYSENKEEIKKINKDKTLSKEAKKELTTKLQQDLVLNPIIGLIKDQEKNCK
jgi:DNA-binding MltR family transcriptional regulator